MTKAGIYLRVSTEEQASKGVSLAGQRKDCEKFAKLMGYSHVEIFEDAGFSAKSMKRPALQDFIDKATGSPDSFDALIVWRMDRLSREVRDHIILGDMLRDFGIRLLSVSESNDETDEGDLLRGISIQLSQYENRKHAKRCLMGMKERLEQGYWTHIPPLGYSSVRTDNGIPELIPNEQAENIKSLFESFSTGQMSQVDLALKAERIGVRTKKNNIVSAQTLNKLLRNPIYKGYLRSAILGETVRANHQAIITEELFNKVQTILGSSNESRRTLRSKLSPDWPLRGVGIKCSRCGLPITAGSPTGRSGISYPKYNCRSCRKQATGISMSADRDVLHQQFRDFLSKIEFKPHTLNYFEESILHEWRANAATERKKYSVQKKRLTILEDKQLSILNSYIDQKISERQKDLMLKQIEPELAQLSVTVKSSDAKSSDIESSLKYAVRFLSNLNKIWTDIAPESRTAFINLIFPSGVSYEFGSGFRTAEISAIFRYNTMEKVDETKSLSKMVIQIAEFWNRISSRPSSNYIDF